jgi:hypothetical protein
VTGRPAATARRGADKTIPVGRDFFCSPPWQNLHAVCLDSPYCNGRSSIQGHPVGFMSTTEKRIRSPMLISSHTHLLQGVRTHSGVVQIEQSSDRARAQAIRKSD